MISFERKYPIIQRLIESKQSLALPPLEWVKPLNAWVIDTMLC
jgi:hypothetical protein